MKLVRHMMQKTKCLKKCKISLFSSLVSHFRTEKNETELKEMLALKV